MMETKNSSEKVNEERPGSGMVDMALERVNVEITYLGEVCRDLINEIVPVCEPCDNAEKSPPSPLNKSVLSPVEYKLYELTNRIIDLRLDIEYALERLRL